MFVKIHAFPFRLAIAVMLIFVLFGCKSKEHKEVDFEKTEPVEERTSSLKGGSLSFAVGAMITPKEGFNYYKRLLDYMGEKLDRRVLFVDRKSYAEINSLLETAELDAAFVCSGPYVEGHDKFGLELLVAPQAYGESVYYSYIIVPADSPVKSFNELSGKTFAFTDPKSNTGKLVPTYMLARMGETPDSYFKKYEFTYAHDRSIKAVAEKMVDGAAVDSLIWEYADKSDNSVTSKTRIIEKSPPYGIPPIAVRPGLDNETKKKLKERLLNVHLDENGREIIRGMMIDKFVSVDDSNYDSVRQMKKWIKQQSEKIKTK
jgi:phosphonate transport system substrate-binding protein